MSAETTRLQRRRVRWLVGLHLGALSGIYVAALVLGGGLAPPPFPPESQPGVRAAIDAETRPSLAPGAAPDPAPDTGQGVLPANVDLAAPWSHDDPVRGEVGSR